MEKEKKEMPVEKMIFPSGYKGKFFKNAVAILLILLIIFLFYQVAFLLTPILNFISILFTPIIISFLFYYLLRPVVYLLERIHIPRVIAIIAIYIIAAILFILAMTYLFPILAEQIRALAGTSVQVIQRLEETSKRINWHTFDVDLTHQIQQRLLVLLQSITTGLSQNLLDVLGWLTRLAAILAVIPFVVFYLLKDDHQFAYQFLKFIPQNFSEEVRKILKNVDTALSSYINGLVIVSLSIGTLLFIGYAFIGLNYALVLSVLAVIFTTIPFVGPFLAILPALFVGLSQGTVMTIKVAIVFIVIQQLESNFVSPQILGQKLNIHPLTIILLLLAAGSLYGLFGLLLATPAYAVSKAIFNTLYKLYRLRYPAKIVE